jgi:uncharacterized caspase-like protein
MGHQLSFLIGMMFSTFSIYQASAGERLFEDSYALVVGVGHFANKHWPTLTHARKDAEGVAQFLALQGYDVYEIYDENATRTNILTVLGEQIAPELTEDDRVVVLFSGHGETRTISGEDFGYIIPYDGDQRYGTWISMTEMREASRQMTAARHQLFIFDACYGGQFAAKGVLSATSEDHPRYVEKISRDKARQYLTAGGKNEVVLAGGPHGYSYFTGYLLSALKGAADFNGDTYITMSELAAYLGPAASNWDHTPRWGSLYGHEQGNFWFRAPEAVAWSSGAVLAGSTPPRFGLKGDSDSAPQHTEQGAMATSLLPPTARGPSVTERAGMVFRDRLADGRPCPYCPEMVSVPPGKVVTGPQPVSIERPFAIGKYEVTFSEWDACVENRGCSYKPSDQGWGRDTKPVINVSWNDAKEYVNWLSNRTGKSYRLLSELEWEYAARAGVTDERFWDGESAEACQFANVHDWASQRQNPSFSWPIHDCDDGFVHTAPVGSFQPNDFSLADVLGNVREWTEERVLRGGSWSKEPKYVHLGNRHLEAADKHADDIGLRIARDLE